ncbi:HNH endonuclease [Arthrobacter sp. BF1]|uniref:HNH endonuclease n=1 Tax=Arthrobacter sp. BF1 TaxID=2821145 RepID=UPI001C4F6417|nr:HNH endonuclease [Arthrobacter sp. BF1]
MNYWWVSHGRNYEAAIHDGMLWNCPDPNGDPEADRGRIKDMRRGDIVFNYFGPYVRAISAVLEKWQDSPRPEGFEKQLDEPDQGWLVRTHPLAENLQLHRQRAADITAVGEPGPFNAAGKPQQRYIFALTTEEGQELLAEAGIMGPQSSASSLRGLPGSAWGTDEPDEKTLTTIRLEQAHLRKNLLRGRQTAPCAICGEHFPARLLIAGHIKPRPECSEEERLDFEHNAMLTCALGCDALYEWGYIVVDAKGRITAGQPTETPRIEATVEALVGRNCTAFTESTAESFAENKRLMLEPQP